MPRTPKFRQCCCANCGDLGGSPTATTHRPIAPFGAEVDHQSAASMSWTCADHHNGVAARDQVAERVISCCTSLACRPASARRREKPPGVALAFSRETSELSTWASPRTARRYCRGGIESDGAEGVELRRSGRLSMKTASPRRRSSQDVIDIPALILTFKTLAEPLAWHCRDHLTSARNCILSPRPALRTRRTCPPRWNENMPASRHELGPGRLRKDLADLVPPFTYVAGLERVDRRSALVDNSMS